MPDKIRAQFNAVGLVQLHSTIAAFEGNIDALRFLCNLDDAGRRELVAELHGPRTLDDLSAEVLNLIAEYLAADVLQPWHLGSLARTCKPIKDAVEDALGKLNARHMLARTLLCGTSFEHVVKRPTTLEWNGNYWYTEDAPVLLDVLKSEAVNLQLTELTSIANLNLGHEGAAAVAAAGGCLSQLDNLCLHQNHIGDAGMQALASAFAGGGFRALEWLELTDNRIGYAGLTALTAAFEAEALPALKALRIGDNKIGDEGAKALLAAAGGGLATLDSLDVNDNELTEAGVEAFTEAIANGKLPSLENLFIGDRRDVDTGHPAFPPGVMVAENPRLDLSNLKAACELRGIKVDAWPLFLPD